MCQVQYGADSNGLQRRYVLTYAYGVGAILRHQLTLDIYYRSYVGHMSVTLGHSSNSPMKSNVSKS